MSDELEKRLRELHDANPINEGEDVESCWGECWIEDIIRQAAAIGAELATTLDADRAARLLAQGRAEALDEIEALLEGNASGIICEGPNKEFWEGFLDGTITAAAHVRALKKTGFDKYIEKQMEDPEFAAGYAAARAEIDKTGDK